MENIDYEALKKRGFLRQKQEGFFVLRTRMPQGIYQKEHLEKMTAIAQKFGRGFVHLTVRQGIEVPFIKFENIAQVEAEFRGAGVEAGTSGARLRATTVCPGNNWCKQGLVDTFSLARRIEEAGIRCGLDLPHKFKIAISGCPNTCTRAQASEVGIHGQIDASSADKRIGYAVYLGGCGGKIPRSGIRMDKMLSEDEVVSLVVRVIEFYKGFARPRQRLGQLIEETGKDKFLEKIGTAP